MKRQTKNFLLSGVILGILALGAYLESAEAQQQRPRSYCAPTAALTEALKERYKEVKVATALSGKEVRVDLFLSPGGSYTITTTLAGTETSCIAIGGDHFEFHKPEVKPEGTAL